MQRITITVDDDLLAQVDEYAASRGYDNRSEAIRDLARNGLQAAATDRVEGRNCVAALVYTYNHEARELARRLTHGFHSHHDLTVASLHVHLDHQSCLEVAVLRGSAPAIRDFGQHLMAERGVSHGRLVSIPVELRTEQHAHGKDSAHSHAHTHVRGTGRSLP